MSACKIRVKCYSKVQYEKMKRFHSQIIDSTSHQTEKVVYNKPKNNSFFLQVCDLTDFTNKCQTTAYV